LKPTQNSDSAMDNNRRLQFEVTFEEWDARAAAAACPRAADGWGRIFVDTGPDPPPLIVGLCFGARLACLAAMDAVTNPGPSPFDPVCLREELTSTWVESGDADQVHARVLRRLKALKAQAQSEARGLLERTGEGRGCAKALALFQDELVRLVYDLSTFHICRALEPAATEPMALVATGGYGRGLMAPGSDVDLLFLLLPSKQTVIFSASLQLEGHHGQGWSGKKDGMRLPLPRRRFGVQAVGISHNKFHLNS